MEIVNSDKSPDSKEDVKVSWSSSNNEKSLHSSNHHVQREGLMEIIQ
jgi:hypothetical protein